MIAVTVDDVAAYAPSAPPVTAEAVAAARDWAQLEYDQADVDVPDRDGRQGRELMRAICAYALSTLPLSTLLAFVSDSGRLTKLKDGDTELTFASSQSADLTGVAFDFEDRAYLHLGRAGLTRRPIPVGYSE